MSRPKPKAVPTFRPEPDPASPTDLRSHVAPEDVELVAGPAGPRQYVSAHALIDPGIRAIRSAPDATASYERPAHPPPRRIKVDRKGVMVRFEPGDKARIERAVEQFDTSQQALIVTAVRDYLDRHGIAE